MVRAFKDPRDPKTGAQFQGMTTSTDPMKQLYISGVFHKAFVEVNEKGTEAAAATSLMATTSEHTAASTRRFMLGWGRPVLLLGRSVYMLVVHSVMIVVNLDVVLLVYIDIHVVVTSMEVVVSPLVIAWVAIVNNNNIVSVSINGSAHHRSHHHADHHTSN